MGWRHLLWDMGGTLIDTYPPVDATFAQVCARHGYSVAVEEVRALTRRAIAEAGRVLAARYRIPPQEFTDAYAALKRSWRLDPPPVMVGARELMAAARELGGLNIVVTHRDRASATDLLHAHRLEVDDLICAPDGHPRKPDPAMHRLAVQRHGLDPAQCLAVGDREIDGRAAEAAGLASALLVTPGLEVPGPQVPGARLVVRSLAELVPLLRPG